MAAEVQLSAGRLPLQAVRAHFPVWKDLPEAEFREMLGLMERFHVAAVVGDSLVVPVHTGVDLMDGAKVQSQLVAPRVERVWSWGDEGIPPGLMSSLAGALLDLYSVGGEVSMTPRALPRAPAAAGRGGRVPGRPGGLRYTRSHRCYPPGRGERGAPHGRAPGGLAGG